MELLLHIVDREVWERAKAAGGYAPESLQKEGFIHCSTRSNYIATAHRYYKGQRNLLLLCIDPGRAPKEIKYEKAPHSEERFPHIYGPLNLDAVIDVIEFPCDKDGYFSEPVKLAMEKNAMPRTKAVEPRLPVSDVGKSITFYCQQLGFTPGAAFPEDSPSFALLSRDQV